MDYQRLVVLKDAPPVAKHSPESRYWRTFKHPLFVKEYAQITAVHFAQSQPHKYAVTVGTQVQVYSPKTHKVTKTIARFKDTTRSACIRPDGKLLAAADDSGLIQIFDLNSRAVLRTLSGHRQPTHSVSFSTALQTQLLSASDDTTVRLWDIPSETELLAFKEHTDYVRSAQIAPENPSIVVSGSYDHSVKLFDTRTGHCEMTLESTPAASFPVEKVLIFPSSTLVSAACGPMMRTWDIVSGGRCLRTVSNHQKSITSLCFTSNSKRILSASLDRLVKVYDTENFNVVHTMRYPSPLLCVATSPDDKTIVAGMTDGTLSIRRRKDGRQEDRPELTSDVISFPSFGELSKKSPPNRSQDAHGVRVSSRRQKKMHDYDRLLKAFKYSAALDAVVGRGVPPRTTFALMTELKHTKALDQALKGRDDVMLEPILRVLLRHIGDPRFGQICCDVATVLLDMYGAIFGHSPVIDNLLVHLQRKIKDELRFQQELSAAKGAIDMMLSSSSLIR